MRHKLQRRHAEVDAKRRGKKPSCTTATARDLPNMAGGAAKDLPTAAAREVARDGSKEPGGGKRRWSNLFRQARASV
eukprot:5418072-Prymnesium_polylepis.1